MALGTKSQKRRAGLLKSLFGNTHRSADPLPQPGSETDENLNRPYNADWAWRPALWRAALANTQISAKESKTSVDGETTLFHDCQTADIVLQQIQNEEARAQFGLQMQVRSFDGSFLSLVVDLPPAGVHGLKRKHLMRMELHLESEQPVEIFARLNVGHGPNTEQVVRQLPKSDQPICIDFDLAYSDLNEKQVENAWVDLIFENPAMNAIVLRDIIFSRRPRAAL